MASSINTIDFSKYDETKISYLFLDEKGNHDIIDYISLYAPIHTRYLLMKYLLEVKSKLFITYFPNDFYKYLYFNDEKMNMEDACSLAMLFFKHKTYSYFYIVKKFILDNYDCNNLAKLMIPYISNPNNLFVIGDKEKEYFKDSDRLFLSSGNHEYYLFKKFFYCLSPELQEKYKKAYNMLICNQESSLAVDHVINNGLLDTVCEYIEKYLNMSECKDIKKLCSGSTATVYQVGDYVIKLAFMKYSYEEEICPNDSYLILPNLEQIYVRNEYGYIIASVEVQKHLTKSLSEYDPYYFEEYQRCFNEEGYYCLDVLVNGKCGDNVMVLDDYHDANIENPETLPDWFKEVPIVLVDHDLVYPIKVRKPKHILDFNLTKSNLENQSLVKKENVY